MARKPSLSLLTPAPPPQSATYVAPSRAGKRSVTCWLDAAEHEEFLIAARRAGTSAQKAVAEMIADWMREHGARLPRR